MKNEEILKKKIQESFIIKAREGENQEDICDKLSSQLYKFILKEPGFTSRNISRGMRGIFTEENREAIILALYNIYLEYINENNRFKYKSDIDAKHILETSRNPNRLMSAIFSNKDMIYRMRKTKC